MISLSSRKLSTLSNWTIIKFLPLKAPVYSFSLASVLFAKFSSRTFCSLFVRELLSLKYVNMKFLILYSYIPLTIKLLLLSLNERYMLLGLRHSSQFSSVLDLPRKTGRILWIIIKIIKAIRILRWLFFACFFVFLRPIMVRLKLTNVVITTHSLMLLNTELK